MIIALCGKAKSGKDTAADYLVRDHAFVKVALADPLKRYCREIYGFTYDQLWGPSDLRNKPDPRYVRLTVEQCRKFETAIAQWEALRGDKLPVHEFLNLTREEYADYLETGCVHLTPRFALQKLGTEWGRDCYAETWVDYCMRVSQKILCSWNVKTPTRYTYDPTRGMVEWHGNQHLPENPQGVVVSDVRFLNEVEGLRARGARNVRVKRPGSGLSGAAAQHKSETEQDSIPDSVFDFVVHNDASLDELFFKVKHVYQTFAEEKRHSDDVDKLAQILGDIHEGRSVVTALTATHDPPGIVVMEEVDVMYDRAVPLIGEIVKLEDGVGVLPQESPAQSRLRGMLESRQRDVEAGKILPLDPDQSDIPPFLRKK